VRCSALAGNGEVQLQRRLSRAVSYAEGVWQGEVVRFPTRSNILHGDGKMHAASPRADKKRIRLARLLCCGSASHHPREGVRVYYIGGNGPHSGERNSSLGLATLGPDRYAGLSGSGSVTTTELKCSGKALTVTADVSSGGSVRIGVAGVAGLSSADAVAITGNVTDQVVKFNGGKDLSGLIGKSVTITIELEKAVVYTVGFMGATSSLEAIVL